MLHNDLTHDENDLADDPSWNTFDIWSQGNAPTWNIHFPDKQTSFRELTEKFHEYQLPRMPEYHRVSAVDLSFSFWNQQKPIQFDLTKNDKTYGGYGLPGATKGR